VEHDQVERETRQVGARLLGVGGDRHAKPVLRQIAAQQVAQPRIVVDDQKVRFEVAHRRLLYAKNSLSPPPRPHPNPPPQAREGADRGPPDNPPWLGGEGGAHAARRGRVGAGWGWAVTAPARSGGDPPRRR